MLSAKRSRFGSTVSASGRFDDTNQMFVPPALRHVHVGREGTPQYWAEQALARLRPAFDPQKPTALFIGRYQPFHRGHQRLIEEGIATCWPSVHRSARHAWPRRKNPLPFFAVKQRIETALAAYAGRFVVIPLPNITNVFYGRDVGYTVERITLDDATEAISATEARRLSAPS